MQTQRQIAAPFRARWRRPVPLVGALMLATGSVGGACSDPIEDSSLPDAGAGAIHYESLAPLCSEISPAQEPNALFTHALVDPAKVSETVVLGDMDPTSPQEILNFELGFYVPSSDVPLVAPADLYVGSIERSYHGADDVTDFGLSYEVCSYAEGDNRKAAVFGNFAHVTSLAAPLNTLFETELQKFVDGQASAVVCSGNANEECTLNMNRLRDQLNDPNYVLVIEAGSPLGLAGPSPGKTGPSGIDANLMDLRKNDFGGNYFINPDRLGAEGGQGLGWRYGACTYEYFVEPYRTQYLARIKNLGQSRVSSEQPCGSVEIDKDAEGTLGGLWALNSIGSETMKAELGGAALDAYLINLLALADHLVAPDTKMMLSTSLDSLSNLTGQPSVIEFDKAVENDANWNKLVNIPFAQTEAGTTYCYSGTRYGGFEAAYYILDLSVDGKVMRLQKEDADCTNVAPELRIFDAQLDASFVFNR